MPKIAAWDLEIHNEIPEGQRSWTDNLPLGITCASVCYIEEDSDEPQHMTWWGGAAEGEVGDRMSPDECAGMLADLDALVAQGYTIFTWNGLSFDWRVLHAELADPVLQARVREHAFSHCDMMFQFFCDRGYPLGLDAVAKGMGMAGKMEGMDGSLAPILWTGSQEDLTQRNLFRWANMSLEERRRVVIEYLEQDALTTCKVAERAGMLHRWNWTSRSNRPQVYNISRWMTVREAMQIPLPDTSWMSRPMTRKNFYSWAEE